MSVDHYENFPVASILCPPAVRPAVVAIYRFARTADDLADEGEAPAEARRTDLLAYRACLYAVARGETPSSASRWADVFIPLQQAISNHGLPVALLDDLLSAFLQDLTQRSYTDRQELLDYCHLSANPVGRLLLCLYRVDGAAALRQSDAICSALQLANFWQDLSVDTARGRLYVPQADAARFAVPADALWSREDTPATRRLVADLVAWTRALMRSGAPLVHAVPGRAGWELRLVVQGGLRILDKIEQRGFATLRTRPTVGWRDAPVMGWRALRMGPAAAPLPEAAR